LISAHLIIHLKGDMKSQVRISREGSRVRWIKADKIIWTDCKRLLPPGYSLSKFGKMCNLPEVKAPMCFEWLTDPDALDRITTLPKDAAAWKSRLTGDGPTQSEVDAAVKFFEESKFQSLFFYLRHYLLLDTVILAKAFFALLDGYFQLMQLCPIESGKLTVSSFSFFSAQTELQRNKRIGNYFCNDARIFSLLKRASHGGICTSLRSVAGKDADYSSYVDLFKRQKVWEQERDDQQDPGLGDEPPPGGELGPVNSSMPTDERIRQYLHRCNTHHYAADLKGPDDAGGCQPADFVTYLDINRYDSLPAAAPCPPTSFSLSFHVSLYAASGE
jgi:hypothetical protein